MVRDVKWKISGTTIPMSEHDNLENAKRWGAAVNSGDFDTFDELVGPGCVDHDPAPNQAQGAKGFKTFFGSLKTAFPDATIAVEKLVQHGDFISLVYTLEGTHTGPFLGIPATGKHIKARGMQLARYENGKLVERWGSSNELGIVQQIGAKIGA